jgi:hypothetical protein
MRPTGDSFRKDSKYTVNVHFYVVALAVVIVILVNVYHFFVAKHISNDKLNYTFSHINT